MALLWHKMKTGYYVAAGRDLIYEIHNTHPYYFALMARPYFNEGGEYTITDVGWGYFAELEEAKSEANLHEMLTSPEPQPQVNPVG